MTASADCEAPRGCAPERQAWRARRGLRRSCLAIALLLPALSSPSANAVSRLVLQVEEITYPGTRIGATSVEIDLTRARPVIRAQAERVEVPEPIGPLRDVSFECTNVYVREPRIACQAGHVTAQGGPTRDISFDVSAEYDTARGAAIVQGSGLPIAGGQARFSGRLDATGWAVEGGAGALDITQVRALVAPWFKAPQSLDFTGHVEVAAQASNRGDGLFVAFDATTPDFNLMNDAGNVVAENLAASLSGTATRTSSNLEVQARLESAKGQALAGPVFLDLAANPLTLDTRGRLNGQTLLLDDITLTQKDLSQARGNARIALGESPRVVLAHVDLANLQFPAAYTSFLQIALATTDLAQLETSGSVRGSIEINDNAVSQLALYVSGVDLVDASKKFSMQDMNADLHWARDENLLVTPSSVFWTSASAYGLNGGASRIEFRTRGRSFELLKPARFPVFDGAVVVDTLSLRHLGAPETELDFDAHNEPISMGQLSPAFGWPPLNGQLSGTVPGISYRSGVLTVDGDITASVFDGVIVGRGLKLENPTGPWPRLYADVTARNLDLALVTSTFEIGTITGRLDADIRGLELFDWSPVAFDARLYSTPSDRSRKLISAKAVTSISNVGGGGGGVAAALQSGFLRFFDEYRYERIGIACRLENEVCTMSGIEPAGMGYYLVKGRGLPRIDVIGNQGRVAWRQLVAQISASMQSEVVIRGRREGPEEPPGDDAGR